MSSLDPPKVEGCNIDCPSPTTLRLKGTIAGKDAINRLGPYFKSLHTQAAARGAEEFCVDVAEVTFANAAAIRLFIEWAVWAKGDKKRIYVMRFRVSRSVGWQTTAFNALEDADGRHRRHRERVDGPYSYVGRCFFPCSTLWKPRARAAWIRSGLPLPELSTSRR